MIHSRRCDRGWRVRTCSGPGLLGQAPFDRRHCHIGCCSRYGRQARRAAPECAGKFSSPCLAVNQGSANSKFLRKLRHGLMTDTKVKNTRFQDAKCLANRSRGLLFCGGSSELLKPIGSVQIIEQLRVNALQRSTRCPSESLRSF